MSVSGPAVLREAFRIAHQRVRDAVAGLTPDQLVWQPQPGANSCAFLLWHIARTADFYIHTRAQGMPEVWERANWRQRLAVPSMPDGRSIGTGFTDQQVGAMPALPPSEYVAYLDALDLAADRWFEGLVPEALLQEREVAGYPRTQLLAILLQSLGHTHAHRGEIGYVKGLMGIPGRA